MLRHHRPLSALVVLLACSCYEYLPARNPTTLIGRRVELTLSDSGAVALASQVGPSTEALQGTLLSDSAGSYRVAMAVSRTRSGSEMDWRGEQISVAHTLVTSLNERRFSPSRSLVASGLAAAGLTGITVGLRGRGSASGNGGTGNKPPVQ
jgi:hypothetical protein